MLLHTTGAKSGKPRLSPLAYLEIDGKMLIVGSYAGARPTRPGCTTCGRTRRPASRWAPTPTRSSPANCPHDERDATYPKIIELAPVFAEYQAKTTRVIPLFELTRA